MKVKSLEEKITIKFAEDTSFLGEDLESESKERAKEIANTIYRILNYMKIPQHHKQIFVLHWKDGMSITELAQIYKLSKQRISQILKTTAKKIKEKYFEEVK